MTHYGMAVPAALLLVSLGIPSAGQTTDDTAASNYVAPGQTPVQVTAPALPAGQKQLTQEELADIMMARKDYREAAYSYKRLVDENPRNAIYWNKLGIALHQQSELSSALKFYQQAVKVNPHYADAQNNIGTIWYQRKKFGKAIRAYQRAIKLRNDIVAAGGFEDESIREYLHKGLAPLSGRHYDYSRQGYPWKEFEGFSPPMEPTAMNDPGITGHTRTILRPAPRPGNLFDPEGPPALRATPPRPEPLPTPPVALPGGFDR